MCTETPSCCNRRVLLLSRASDPETLKPWLCSTSAMPHMPAPPIPTKCTRLTRSRMHCLQTKLRDGIVGVRNAARTAGLRHAPDDIAVLGELFEKLDEAPGG